MRIIPDFKATFGDTYFLGYTAKMKFDKSTNKKTDEIEGYICRLSSSELQGQFDVTIPTTVAIQDIKFNQKICLKDVEILPYAKSSQGTAFAEVILRCTAKNILNDSTDKHVSSRNEALK